MTPLDFSLGQRWHSLTEPELGLGTVVQAEFGRVQLIYPATGEMRLYAVESAPLQRVEFEVGQEVENHEGEKRIVISIRDEEGVLTYCGKGWELPEAHLGLRDERIALDVERLHLLGLPARGLRVGALGNGLVEVAKREAVADVVELVSHGARHPTRRRSRNTSGRVGRQDNKQW